MESVTGKTTTSNNSVIPNTLGMQKMCLTGQRELAKQHSAMMEEVQDDSCFHARPEVISPHSSNSWQLAKVEGISKKQPGDILINWPGKLGQNYKVPHPHEEENVIVCLLYGNFFVYMYKLGMALMLQLRICLATTLSSVLSNRFLNVTFLLLTGHSTFNN